MGDSEIRDARQRLEGLAVRTPLVRLFTPEAPREIYLKLENLQPGGSFKIRGAGNALMKMGASQRERGVVVASAGNMALGAALLTSQFGIPLTVIAPETAPAAKLDALDRLGARVIRVSFERWWQTFQERRYPGVEGTFVHAFDDPDVIAGNGTVGLEVLEQLPDVGKILVPWGGGGLACGIASAVAPLGIPVVAVEVETAAPLTPSFAAGEPKKVEHVRSFVDGIGSGTVFPSMLERARGLLEGTAVASLQGIASAIRLLAERHRVIAEGAGAASLAAALAETPSKTKVVCIVSGGNINLSILSTLFSGQLPT